MWTLFVLNDAKEAYQVDVETQDLPQAQALSYGMTCSVGLGGIVRVTELSSYFLEDTCRAS